MNARIHNKNTRIWSVDLNEKRNNIYFEDKITNVCCSIFIQSQYVCHLKKNISFLFSCYLNNKHQGSETPILQNQLDVYLCQIVRN